MACVRSGSLVECIRDGSICLVPVENLRRGDVLPDPTIQSRSSTVEDVILEAANPSRPMYTFFALHCLGKQLVNVGNHVWECVERLCPHTRYHVHDATNVGLILKGSLIIRVDGTTCRGLSAQDWRAAKRVPDHTILRAVSIKIHGVPTYSSSDGLPRVP